MRRGGGRALYLFFIIGLIVTAVNVSVYLQLSARANRIAEERAAVVPPQPVDNDDKNVANSNGGKEADSEANANSGKEGDADPDPETAAPPLKHHAAHHRGQHSRHPHHRHHPGADLASHHATDRAAAVDADKKPAHHSHQTKPPGRRKLPGGREGDARIRKRRAFAVDAASFSNETYATLLARYHAFLTPPVPLEQSSEKFTDVYEPVHLGVRLPTTAKQMTALAEGADAASVAGGTTDSNDDDDDGDDAEGGNRDEAAERCDPLDADFTPESDAACLAYLRNPHNWRSIKPMSSILSAGRTIKFKVRYKHDNVSAVMKVSQKKFALEPASEVLAFYTDRVLGFQRVPPVVWTPFPLDFLRAACSLQSPLYVQWFQRFVLDYEVTRALRTARSAACHGMETYNVSLQLWLADVHDADETALAPPEHYRRYLTLHRQADPGDPPPQGAELLPGDVLSDVVWSAQPRLLHVLLRELVAELLFDFIIGNTDRWFGHNSFALGACVSADTNETATAAERDAFFGPPGPQRLPAASCKPPPPWGRSKSEMRIAFIDQGSAFYKKGAPPENAFAKDGHENMCRFPRRVGRAIRAHSEEKAFYHEVKRKLPGGLFNIANPTLLRAADTRLQLLRAHIESCVQRFGEQNVLFFD